MRGNQLVLSSIVSGASFLLLVVVLGALSGKGLLFPIHYFFDYGEDHKYLTMFTVAVLVFPVFAVGFQSGLRCLSGYRFGFGEIFLAFCLGFYAMHSAGILWDVMVILRYSGLVEPIWEIKIFPGDEFPAFGCNMQVPLLSGAFYAGLSVVFGFFNRLLIFSARKARGWMLARSGAL